MTFLDSLRPPQLLSWQTLILLSIGWGFLSFLLPEPFQLVGAIVSSLLLLIGFGWFTTENPIVILGISLGPWITAAFVSLLLFRTWNSPISPLVIWPIVSAIIAAIPEFVQADLTFRIIPSLVRQKLILMFLIHAILSCWLQFGFCVQNWVQEYPSLLADDLTQSAFVFKISYQSSPTTKGHEVLNSIDQTVVKELDNKPWGEVEKWLLDANQRIESIGEQALKELSTTQENQWWEFGADILSREPGYNLQLIANWQGPSSKREGYFQKKSCQILPTQRVSVPGASATSQQVTVASPNAKSQVKCGPVSQPIPRQSNSP